MSVSNWNEKKNCFRLFRSDVIKFYQFYWMLCFQKPESYPEFGGKRRWRDCSDLKTIERVEDVVTSSPPPPWLRSCNQLCYTLSTTFRMNIATCHSEWKGNVVKHFLFVGLIDKLPSIKVTSNVIQISNFFRIFPHDNQLSLRAAL